MRIFRFQFLVLISLAWVQTVHAVPSPKNEAVLRQYDRIHDKSPSTKKGLSAAEREDLFHFVHDHEVASPWKVSQYEPFPSDPRRQIGYCFGRAMAVHLRARIQGLEAPAIKKLFIVGDLRSGKDPEWGFHVTTLVKGDDGKWYAVDPIMKEFTQGKSQTAQEWIDVVRRVWDTWHGGTKEAKLYLTSTSSIIPEARDQKNPIWDFDNFKPGSDANFTAGGFGGKETVWETNQDAEDKYFAGAHEKGDAAFPFLGIWLTIDPKHGPEYFNFKNYFVELMTKLRARPRAVVAASALNAEKPKRALGLSVQLVNPRTK